MKTQTKVMFLLWCIVLFHPFRLLNNIAGGLSPLFRTQTIILYCMTIFWVFTSDKKTNYPVLMLIVITHVFGTIFIAENTGWARPVTRIIFDAYLLGLITFSFLRDEKYLGTLFDLLTISFCYWAIWGIIGKGLVRWDFALSDENQYGVFMSMGAVFSYFYYLGHQEKKRKLLGFITSGLCIVGVIASFSRGSFITIVLCGGVIWLQSSKKIITAIVIGFAVIIGFIAADRIFPENQFWDEIRTISQGTSESTASDRVILWGIAMEEFKDNPVFGVGPHNFGIRAPEYATSESATRYPNVRTLWGRSLHNIYFQTLCEQGIVGVVLAIAILLGFIKMNSKTRLYIENFTAKSLVTDDTSLQEITKYYYFSKAIQFAMLCYLIGGVFYPIYEYDWFWDLLILNMLLYLIIVQDKYGLPEESDTETI